MRVRRPAPKLAALLLKEHTDNAFQGTRVTDLMLESDCIRFEEHFSGLSSQGENNHAISIHVGLRDASGAAVQVRMVPFQRH